jgi:beta-glucosidase
MKRKSLVRISHFPLVWTCQKKINKDDPHITGIDELNDASLSLEEALVDNHRIDYFYRHFKYLNRAIK